MKTIAALLLCASVASAQPSLETALLAQMRLPSGHYVAHCRRARGGCEARVHELATLLINAASREGVDAYLLAAIAFHESALNADAVGRAGDILAVEGEPRGRVGLVCAVLLLGVVAAWCVGALVVSRVRPDEPLAALMTLIGGAIAVAMLAAADTAHSNDDAGPSPRWAAGRVSR